MSQSSVTDNSKPRHSFTRWEIACGLALLVWVGYTWGRDSHTRTYCDDLEQLHQRAIHTASALHEIGERNGLSSPVKFQIAETFGSLKSKIDDCRCPEPEPDGDDDPLR